MLVLSRMVGEEIVIAGGTSNEVRITVEDISHGRVKIGVKAPLEMQVNRKEIQDIIDGENDGCAKSDH